MKNVAKLDAATRECLADIATLQVTSLGHRALPTHQR